MKRSEGEGQTVGSAHAWTSDAVSFFLRALCFSVRAIAAAATAFGMQDTIPVAFLDKSRRSATVEKQRVSYACLSKQAK